MDYPVLSSRNVSISCNQELGCQWDVIASDMAIETDRMNDNVVFIQANKISKYKVQLQQ